MKVEKIEVTLKNSENEKVNVVVDLFYREISIYRPGQDSSIAKAISASVLQAMAFDVSYTILEAKQLLLFVWNLMDLEGKNIMEAGIPHITFGE